MFNIMKRARLLNFKQPQTTNIMNSICLCFKIGMKSVIKLGISTAVSNFTNSRAAVFHPFSIRDIKLNKGLKVFIYTCVQMHTCVCVCGDACKLNSHLLLDHGIDSWTLQYVVFLNSVSFRFVKRM